MATGAARGGRLELGRGEEDLLPKTLSRLRNMRTNPRECREHAQRCRQLALRAPSAQAEVSYLDTARAWEQRAAEIEGAQAFVKTMAQIGVRSEPEAA